VALSPTVVDRLYSEFAALMTQLGAAEPSLRVSAEDTFRKALLLAAASHFETCVTLDLLAYAEAESNELIAYLVRNKALKRQYHTLFDWDDRSAMRFFGLFGEGFKQHMKATMGDEPAYRAAVDAFLELGADRNSLVHHGYGSFVLEKTTEEIYTCYQMARGFAETVSERLRAYLASRTPDAPNDQVGPGGV